MTDRDRDLRELPPDDDAFVRRVAELYAPPPLSAERRVAWRARLDQRVARPRRRLGAGALALLAGAAAALLAAWLAVPALRGPAPDGGTVVAQAAPSALTETAAAAENAPATPEDALLGLTSESVAELDEALPDDYLAIESLLL